METRDDMSSSRFSEQVRAAWYLTGSFVSGTAILLLPPLLFAAAMLVLVGGIGFLLLAPLASLLHLWSDGERRRVGRYLAEPIEPRYRPVPLRPGAQLRHVFRSPSFWRDLAWSLAHSGLAVTLGVLGLYALVGVPVTVAQMALWWWAPDTMSVSMFTVEITSWAAALGWGTAQLAVVALLLFRVVRPAARWHARAMRALLTPSRADRLAARVTTLTATRAGAQEAHTAELRRIERDLHDGTQAQLVALAMRLGLAERSLGQDPDATAQLLHEARAGAEAAMADLREVIRTIYPPILADRGLVGAASSLMALSAVPARLSVGELGGLPAAVESTAYFVVAEALTNAAKHAQASSVEVVLERHTDRLTVRVVDDGAGGVDETRGSGVAGMRRRVAALDGEFTVHGPTGGPTTVRAVLPCGR